MIGVLSDVSKAFDVGIGRLVQKSTGWDDVEATRARMAAYSIARLRHKISLVKIGKLIGGRDHSTIIHGIKRCNDLLATDPDFAAAYRKARRG